MTEIVPVWAWVGVGVLFVLLAVGGLLSESTRRTDSSGWVDSGSSCDSDGGCE